MVYNFYTFASQKIMEIDLNLNLHLKIINFWFSIAVSKIVSSGYAAETRREIDRIYLFLPLIKSVAGYTRETYVDRVPLKQNLIILPTYY